MSQTSLKQKVGLHIDIIMLWDYSTIYWNFSIAFFEHTAHGCQIKMCHQNYSKLSGTFYTGVILILYRANIRFYVPPGGNLNFSLITVQEGNIDAQELSANLPPLGASPELTSCATWLKFKYVGVTVFSSYGYPLWSGQPASLPIIRGGKPLNCFMPPL